MNRRKLRAALSGVAACGVLGAFLVGVPVCLVRLVGNPLPSALPAWSSVVAAVESGVLPPGVAIGVVAVVVWIWWSQVALSVAVEVVAASQGRMARALPLNAFGMQPLVVRLVALVLTAAGTLGLLTQPVVAATPSFAGIAVPGTAGEPVRAGAGEIAVAAPSAGGAPGSESLGAPSPARAPAAPPAPILAAPLGAPATPPVSATPESALESAPHSTAPILAPPENRRASSVRVSPPGSPALMHEIASPEGSGALTAQDAPPVPGVRSEPGAWTRSDPVITGVDPVAAADRLSDERSATAEIGTSGWVVVEPGDSLWLLAEKHLGDALRWQDIFDLNTGPLPGGGTLRDPNLIHPGWRLRLPTPAPRVSFDPTGDMQDFSANPNIPPRRDAG